jgi:hypothetical protein
MAKTKKNNETKTKRMKSVDQMTIARLVANRTGLSLTEVQEVIELEQKYTMDYIKKNYLTLTPIIVKGRTLKCPINGEVYDLPTKRGVSVRVGDGFKSYISGTTKKMPDKMCRFVDGAETLDNMEEVDA